MAKQFKDKLKLLKDVVNGNQSLKVMKPPAWYVVFENGEVGSENITYEIDGREYTKKEYDKWKSSLADHDTVIHFITITDYGYKSENEPIKEDPILVPLEVKVVQLPEEKPVDKKIVPKKTEPCSEPVIAPQLRPYADHIRFNERIIQKLFS